MKVILDKRIFWTEKLVDPRAKIVGSVASERGTPFGLAVVFPASDRIWQLNSGEYRSTNLRYKEEL